MPFTIIRHARLFALLGRLPLALLTIYTLSAFRSAGDAPLTLESACHWGVATQGRLFDWTTWQTVAFSDAALLRDIQQMDNSDNTAPTGVIVNPADAVTRYRVTLTTANGQHHFDVRLAPSQLGWVYIIAYKYETPTTDAYGHRFGLHGCNGFGSGGAFRLPVRVWNDLIMRIEG